MNKIISASILILAGFTACVSDKPKDNITNQVIFSGKIENPNSDTINILNRNREVVKSIVLNKDLTFRDTLDIGEGYYRLNDGKEGTQIYLEPNFDLSLTLNSEQFDESLLYKGKGGHENNYLAKKALLMEGFGKLNYFGYYGKLSESDFLNLTDSLYNIQTQLLENSMGISADFAFIESKSLEFSKMRRFAGFQNTKRYITGDKSFVVSESFPDPFKAVDLNNGRLLISPNYLFYIKTYLKKIAKDNTIGTNENKDSVLEYIKTVKREVKNAVIKKELIYSVGIRQLNYTEQLDRVYKEIKSVLTDESRLKVVSDKYNTLKKIEKGAVSPNFTYKDINEKSVSLQDLKGKLVYIDIWATWCLPCIKEIPHLKTMEEGFRGKDIHFVSICQADKKPNWEKMLLEKELGGIQLFAPDEHDSFFTDFNVQGIPRFILIDQDGKIIDAHAKRPSNPKLKEEIESYL